MTSMRRIIPIFTGVLHRRWIASVLNVFTVFLLSAITPYAYPSEINAGITLNTEHQSVYLGDSVIIDIEAIGLLDELDVSVLSRDAEFLRETRGTRIAVVNERVVDIKTRRMEFLPKEMGRVFFGPLKGEHTNGTATSNTLVVNVLPAIDTQWKPTANDHRIQVTLSNAKPFIGQKITLNITLKHRHPITNESITLPQLSGFDVLPVFESRRIIDNSESNPWRVTEWQYFLFAQRSGTLHIDDVSWTGTMVRSRTQRGEFNLTKTLEPLQVYPAPISNDWWLPASSVTLSEVWSIDVKELSAGDEVMRTITLSAQDVLANHLPVIDPLPSRAITSTLIKQTRDHQLTGEMLTATVDFQFRVTAQSPVPVFLDTVRVPWWNTLTNEPSEVIIPARRINVRLPDRADLLSDMALANDPLARIKLTLQSTGRGWSSWHWLLGALAILALWVLVREVRWQWLAHRARHTAKKLGKHYSVFDSL